MRLGERGANDDGRPGGNSGGGSVMAGMCDGRRRMDDDDNYTVRHGGDVIDCRRRQRRRRNDDKNDGRLVELDDATLRDTTTSNKLTSAVGRRPFPTNFSHSCRLICGQLVFVS